MNLAPLNRTVFLKSFAPDFIAKDTILIKYSETSSQALPCSISDVSQIIIFYIFSINYNIGIGKKNFA